MADRPPERREREVPPAPGAVNPRITGKPYAEAIAWILDNRGGGGGNPPQFVSEVSGWKVVQFVSFLYRRPVNLVASDVVQLHQYRLLHGGSRGR